MSSAYSGTMDVSHGSYSSAKLFLTILSSSLSRFVVLGMQSLLEDRSVSVVSSSSSGSVAESSESMSIVLLESWNSSST